MKLGIPSRRELRQQAYDNALVLFTLAALAILQFLIIAWMFGVE